MAAAGGILAYFTRHATAANIVLVIFIAAGLYALPRMRAQYFPDVVIQSVNVSVAWPGAGAEDVDRAIVQVLEAGLLAVEGVESVSSTAREGNARISLDFEPGWDMGRALDEVESAVAAASDLPEDAESPEVKRGAWRDRVTDVVITGPIDTEQLGRFADEFVARLFAIGVTRTTVQGIAAPEVIVEVPTAALMRHDVTLSDIARSITAEADADPAGEVADGSARLRTGVEKRTPEALAGIVLRTNADGSALTLGDVALVRTEGADRVRAYFVGDDPAVTIRVDRSDQGDAIGIQRQVEDVAAEMRLSLPAGVSIDLIRARSEDINARLALLLDNGAKGLALVVLLLFLFLNARTAFWVAAGIPVAMLAAVAMMYAFGLTLNMISLFALILTLGIVVDDAIVVGEHTDFRVRQLGEAPFSAAETAVRRMAAPVFSSTITTVLAFLGLVAIGGRFGDLIKDIPFTVSVVLMASLLECFLILPNHMAHALSKAGRGRWYDAPSRVMNRGLAWVRERIFRPLTRGVIVARYPVLAGALALLAYEAGLFIRGDVQWRFFNSPEQASVTGNFAMLPGATREDTLAVMKGLQEATAKVAEEYRTEYGGEPIKYVIAEIGGNAGRALSSADTKDASQLGAISVELSDPDLRPWTSYDFVADLQDAAPRHPMLEELSFRGWRQGPGGDALDIELSGADSETLKAAAEAIKLALVQFPEVSALQDTLPYDKDELVLDLTPQGRALGFSVDALGRELRDRLNGIEAAKFPVGSRSATIRVELPPGELTADFLDRTMLRGAAGGYVPLSDIVTVSAQSGFSTIKRENGQRVVSVTGDIAEDEPERANEILAVLDAEILPRIAEDYRVAYHLAGLSEQEDTFLNEALIGLIAALTAIFAVLAWIFSSWTRPMAVMLVIPLGLIGAIHGHYIWGVPLSMFSVVGMIGMSGIIINDAIVLISTVDEYAASRGRIPAIVDAVADRLRPVMLTTLTTVLGLAPLLYEGSRQAEFLKPTVITLCYGLGFGFFLVLMAVPALLAVQHDVSRQFAAFRRARRVPALRWLVAAAALAMAVVFALTLGAAILDGAALSSALGRFALGCVAIACLAAALGAVFLRPRRQPLQP
ncbi:MAG: efflux RND transporter permease subunit [Rhodobacteraceae bacterium]|nr:efflux RND transporter permease subunit [Paracoccaceae bacterium]